MQRLPGAVTETDCRGSRSTAASPRERTPPPGTSLFASAAAARRPWSPRRSRRCRRKGRGSPPGRTRPPSPPPPSRPARPRTTRSTSTRRWTGPPTSTRSAALPSPAPTMSSMCTRPDRRAPSCSACTEEATRAARQMKDKARVVAMDLRGHGKSTTSDDLDLSIDTLTNDVIAVIRTMYGDLPPAIILVGHSMGGSVAVHVASRREIRNLHGLVVIDVVEGTAMASLVHMQKILSNRAQHFPSIEKAIEWSVKGGPLRNIESARVSIPSTLKYDESRECYTYRTPLEQTEKYWKGWYEGLSDKFLSCPVQKILLLAGTDRLDRALTIGQMQGKFQMVVVRHTGHAIQEDVPEEFASHILNFISRNKIGPNGVEIPGLIKKWGH
ncbi:protein phosphatase methylesterase 1-like isoform X2 [Panicum virgatum]|uniref:protein phosphatase methylesterase 1-like isoform X2 n=1 Tax=Panicum virgatum TaxID=38727 RepID=UPI0019D569AA|nr:protein phosphatase methylesterase 1-like isoform X2 [Panicum virgatum]